jgi:hypothetical protein
MAEPVLLGISNTKFIKDATTKAKSLFCPNGFLNGNYETMHDETGDYQVGVGKKFVITNITIVGASNATGQKNSQINYHNVVDTSGGTKLAQWQSITTFPYSYETYIEIPAGNYVNAFGEANSINIMVYGVELDV